MTELLGLPFSPWSEKARWALEARRVPYKERLYMPLIGEPALRWKLGKWTGNVTVPVLTDDDGEVFADSSDIAKWADGRGEGPTLFPPLLLAEITRFVDLSERGLAAGRALSLARTLESRAALREMTPKNLRRMLGGLAPGLGAIGVRRTLRKYGSTRSARDTHVKVLVEVLDELRSALAKPSAADPKTLLGPFTFADIAMSQVLVFVEPPRFGLRIGVANRAAFTDDALRAAYPDLLAWRDALYEAFRPKR
jgi:glutathione S-transferase